MWFLAKDNNIPISDLVITDNLASYHNVISFTCPGYIDVVDGTIQTNYDKFDVHIVNQVEQDDTVKIDCVSKEVHNTFDSNTAGFTGYTTIDKLFSKLGFKYNSKYQSNNTYFSIPQCMVTTLFDNLTNYASFSNGGGAHFYMLMDGTICGFDYKLIMEKSKPIKISGRITASQRKLDWVDYTPSEYDLYYWDNENKFKKDLLTIKKGFGKGSVHLNDTTGVWKEPVKQRLTNQFYNKWYSSNALTVTMTLGCMPPIGSLVELEGFDRKYIVKAVSLLYNEMQELPMVTTVLITNPDL